MGAESMEDKQIVKIPNEFSIELASALSRVLTPPGLI